jgi:hypothetical protein
VDRPGQVLQDGPNRGKPDDMQPVRGEIVLGGMEPLPGLTIDRLNYRRTLREQLEAQARQADSDPALHGFSTKQRLAYDLINSREVREAFDLRSEPDRVRRRYGDTLFGKTLLMGRRMVERGVRFVNVSWDNMRERFSPPASYQVWDTHQRNFAVLRENHLPHLDHTYSAFMEDMDQRGLLDDTLVVMMGEMGRTPKLNPDGGRDHWTFCYSVILAGAGIKGGTVYGSSDSDAAYPKDHPVRIRDICATIYHCLGIDPEMPVYDHGGRPFPVAQGGKPVEDILA